MEIVLWSVLCIIVIIAGVIRLSFSFPQKANKTTFWIISSIAILIVGAIVYLVVRGLNL